MNESSDAVLKRSIVDEEQLRLLSLGYLVSAVITGLFSLLGLFYMFMGLMMGALFAAGSAAHANGDAPPAFMGLIFALFGGLFFVGAVALASAKYLTSRYLKQRRSPLFCQVVAGISCLSIPYGTLLGVCTFVVLGRPSVAALFKPTDTAAP